MTAPSPTSNASELERAEWVLSDEELVLQVGADIRPVSAARIFACEYRGVREWEGVRVDDSPSVAISGLRIERMLCDVGLDVFVPAAPSDHSPYCRPHLRCGRSVIAMPLHVRRSVDHCIVDSTWYAFAHDDVDSLETALGVPLVEAASRTSLAQVVRLRSASDLSIRWFPLTDETGATRDLNDHQCWNEVLAVAPFPYQRRGLAWLARLAEEDVGGLLADEMGLGKTLQAIGLVAWRRRLKKGPCLVVTPTSLVENWRREFAKFAPAIPVMIHQGATRTGSPSALAAAQCVITTYDCMVRDEALFHAVSWDVVVLDEAQYIKNPDSLRSRVAVSIPRQLGLAVTGTPLENRLLDLWSLFSFAIPGLLGGRAPFEQMVHADGHAGEAVADVVSPFMLRRRLADVRSDLPSRREVVTAISLEAEQAEAYESLRRNAIAGGSRKPSLATLTTLRQFCGHPWLVGRHEGDPVHASLKVQRLLDILEVVRQQSERALVFAPFQDLLDLLSSIVREQFGAAAQVIDGRTPVAARQEIIDSFSECRSFDILLLNPRAAGVGLNITAANHVVHFCPEWNPAVMDQATARSHRTGQERCVTVHRLYFADTVEDVMEARLATKRGLIGEVVQDNDADPLSPADIAAALNVTPLARHP